MIFPPAVSPRSRLRWHGENMVLVPGDLRRACERIPTFTRYQFGANQQLDAVVRDPDDAIPRSGYDGAPQDRFERVLPHERDLGDPTLRVPGAPERSETLFDVVQVLSWIASSRNNLKERISWRAQIPALVPELGAAA